jgi:hypothetical protein
MKARSLTLAIFGVVISLAQAGPHLESSKETTAPPCPTWYADREWNLGISGVYAFAENNYPYAGNTLYIGDRSQPLDGGTAGEYDRYIEADHAWGVGIDLKYFFTRYFGVGIQGWIANAQRSVGTVTVVPSAPNGIGSSVLIGNEHEDRTVGSLLGTFTFRFPMNCSRFAPYLWLGGGAVFGGGELDEIVINDIPSGAFLTTFHRGPETRAVGQFGGGFEVRFTPHIGWTNDFSWNVVDGTHNNFGTARTGINFAF